MLLTTDPRPVRAEDHGPNKMSAIPETTSLQARRPPRWRTYGTLVKSLQTGLLVLTGIAGLASARGWRWGLASWLA